MFASGYADAGGEAVHFVDCEVGDAGGTCKITFERLKRVDMKRRIAHSNLVVYASQTAS